MAFYNLIVASDDCGSTSGDWGTRPLADIAGPGLKWRYFVQLPRVLETHTDQRRTAFRIRFAQIIDFSMARNTWWPISPSATIDVDQSCLSTFFRDPWFRSNLFDPPTVGPPVSIQIVRRSVFIVDNHVTILFIGFEHLSQS
jgi:hypothetical protein